MVFLGALQLLLLLAVQAARPRADRLLTAEEVGEMLGRHPRTVLQMAVAGKIPAIRLGHRTVRFDPDDVRAYIDAHRAAS